MKRIESIDVVRGIVMIIMALDHVRDLIHVNAFTQSPTDLATTTPLLFFTRLITHLCAPTFVFLAGTSAYVVFKRNGNIAETQKFLIKRGLWLILLEFTIINFGIFFDFGFHSLIFLVIAAIGFGFIVLALLLNFSSKTLGIIGLTIIACHNLLPLIPFEEGSVIKQVLSPFFGPAAFPITKGLVFVIGYPPIPWLGVILLGFACGKLFELPGDLRNSLFVKFGLGLLVTFLVLRFVNIYGDPALWSVQKNGVFTLLSFLNVSKYPPSLLFCALTLGIMFLMLSIAEKIPNATAKVFTVYGKVPLFYFIVHFYLIHIILLIVMYLQGFESSQFDFSSGTYGRPKGVESGLHLGAIYLIWIGVLLILYKPCQWFGQYKSQNTYWWLKYL